MAEEDPVSTTDSSTRWNCLVHQLDTIEALGDVYVKKKRLRKIIVELEALYDGLCHASDPSLGGLVDPVSVKRIIDKAKQDEEDIQIAENELVEEEVDDERRGFGQEVVGDIDDLLGGLTLRDDNDTKDILATQRRPVAGRRYKKVVRASGRQRRQPLATRDVNDDTDGSVDGCPEDDMPTTRGEDDTTDEEAKRYAVPESGRTRLTVEIPIQHEVLAQAQQRDPMAGHDRGSSGSTHAHCGVHHVHNADGVSSTSYDSDDSITSPAIRTVHVTSK